MRQPAALRGSGGKRARQLQGLGQGSTDDHEHHQRPQQAQGKAAERLQIVRAWFGRLPVKGRLRGSACQMLELQARPRAVWRQPKVCCPSLEWAGARHRLPALPRSGHVGLATNAGRSAWWGAATAPPPTVAAAHCRRRLAPLHPAERSPTPALHCLPQGASELTGEERPAVKAKPRVEKNRVLVTGGAGFVGSHLCDYLVARGDHVGAGPAVYLFVFCCLTAV